MNINEERKSFMGRSAKLHFCSWIKVSIELSLLGVPFDLGRAGHTIGLTGIVVSSGLGTESLPHVCDRMACSQRRVLGVSRCT